MIYDLISFKKYQLMKHAYKACTVSSVAKYIMIEYPQSKFSLLSNAVCMQNTLMSCKLSELF